MLLTADTLLTGRELLRPGWIEVSQGTVDAVGAGASPRPADRDLGAVTVVPGFVDTHLHGGGGANFSAARRAETATAVAFHRRHGTTTLVASLVTAGPAELLRQVGGVGRRRSRRPARRHPSRRALALRQAVRRPPAVADARPRPRRDRPRSRGGRGAIRMVTIAPERDGAVAAIRQVVDAGVVAAVGHTDATYEQTRAAIDAGATVGTHLFNAMRPINTREPGPVIALLEDPRVTVELITDGVHVHPALYRHVSRSAGPDRVSLVTDAMAAAGMSDGRYWLGPLAVDVVGGVARVAGTRNHRGQHRDHGPPVPVRRRPQPAAPRRGADGGCASSVDQSGPCVGPAVRRARCRSERRPGGAGRRSGCHRCAAPRIVARRTGHGAKPIGARPKT